MNSYDECMQKVLTTIEKELEYVTIEELVRVAGYSYYHFHRIFKAYTGESLKKYIKRLQLENALKQMQIDRDNITQIAIKSGYSTASSFNKAFKEMFGVNPSEYKQSLLPKRKHYQQIDAQRIVHVPDIEVYCIRHVGEYEKLDQTWDKILQFAQSHGLITDDFYAYAIAHDNPDISDMHRLRYDACISASKKIKTNTPEIQSQTLAGGKYAVFLHTGKHEALGDTYDAIFGAWIHKHAISLRELPVFQKFLNNKNEVPSEALLTEVWVPLG